MRRLVPILTAGAFAAAMAATTATIPAGAAVGMQPQAGAVHATAATRTAHSRLPGGFKHLVVIYQENHSFDNLYGRWGKVHGQEVNGLNHAPSNQTVKVPKDGSAYSCLLKNDPSLTWPPLTPTCQDPKQGVPASHFANRPFSIDNFIATT